jgi:serine/tyrosine/threonine adenylyltransferase
MSSTNTSPGWHFNNSYTLLPEPLFAPTLPTPVAAPVTVLLNGRLAKALGLDFAQTTPAQLAAFFSGNALPPDALPIAQAYAGHQFGGFNMLGDGRAILLGEQITPDGQRFDIQLKGAGPSLYSRRGDGRATLSAVLREYLMSEAMYHLGIATTGSLAATVTGEQVRRETLQPGAVLTRVAASHIRVGTFEYVGRFESPETLQTFIDYTIQRHYPLLLDAENRALALLEAVLQRQVALIVHWMRVGFIHGVMNTDNMSIAGETIDYGPCAFMNRYHPATAFSAIDQQRRYAYGNQPPIAQWNLARLAGTLLPLIDAVPEKAIELAQPIIDKFPTLYAAAWLAMMRQKLGWAGEQAEDADLIAALLDWMEQQGADYTNTFLLLQAHLADADNPVATAQWMEEYGVIGSTGLREEGYDETAFKKWLLQWRQRLAAQGQTDAAALAMMQAVNPAFIPRNHNVEAALEAATTQQDFSLFNQLLEVLSNPYQPQADHQAYQMPPVDDGQGYQTFCNT